jgi:hypothetical protein
VKVGLMVGHWVDHLADSLAEQTADQRADLLVAQRDACLVDLKADR